MASDFSMGQLRLTSTEFTWDSSFQRYTPPEGTNLTRVEIDLTWTGDLFGSEAHWYIFVSPDPIVDGYNNTPNNDLFNSSYKASVSNSKGLNTVSGTDGGFVGEFTSPKFTDGTYYVAAFFRAIPFFDSNPDNNMSNVVQITLSGGPSGSGNGGPTQPSAEVRSAFAANTDAANGLSAAYHVLLGGVPNEAGFVSLINSAVSTNFGAGPGPVFNTENIFINLINNLVQGNQTAKARFDAIATGTTLQEKITSIYQALVPPSKQTAEGLAFLTSAQNIAFYQGVAAERGVAGTDGAAIVAMASLLKIVVGENIGVGNAINDLAQAVAAGNAALPASGSTFTDIEVADGTAFDADDAAAIARMAAAAEPAPFAYVDDGGGPVSDHEGHNVQLSGAAVAADDGLFLT